MAKILIVEDNPTNMKLTAMLLARVGHQVLQAVDAETGLALALTDHRDLILMDLQLPGMDGFEATTGSTRVRALASACPQPSFSSASRPVAVLEIGMW